MKVDVPSRCVDTTLQGDRKKTILDLKKTLICFQNVFFFGNRK